MCTLTLTTTEKLACDRDSHSPATVTRTRLPPRLALACNLDLHSPATSTRMRMRTVIVQSRGRQAEEVYRHYGARDAKVQNLAAICLWG